MVGYRSLERGQGSPKMRLEGGQVRDHFFAKNIRLERINLLVLNVGRQRSWGTVRWAFQREAGLPGFLTRTQF